MNADEDFETKIIVKVNMPEVLRKELARKTWQRERVALGTATDPYQPGEGRYRITRGCLEALRDGATPVSIVTKSTLVWRDRDVLVDLAQLPGTRVNFTITTLDANLSRLVEPGTPPPAQRLQVMRHLTEAGIPCGVYLAPVLPGLTDSEEAIAAVAEAARAHGATSFWGGVLRLAPLVKEHYFGFVGEAFPEMLHRYQRAYPRSDAPRDYRDRLDERIARAKERYGFAVDNGEVRTPEAAVANTAPRAPARVVPANSRLPFLAYEPQCAFVNPRTVLVLATGIDKSSTQVYVHCTPNADGSNPERGWRADADGPRAQALDLLAFCCVSARGFS
jgi:DNA repair photolyase